jgi:hypothetical protein
LLQNKYLQSKILSQVQVKPTDSSFWEGIMSGSDEFFQWGCFVIDDGMNTRFWEDLWLGSTPLSSQYPTLYNIIRYKHVRVADVLAHTPLHISFSHVLRDDKWKT